MEESTDTSPRDRARDATPSVLAVIVAHRPGEWFEETLDSLRVQDYPRLSTVVIDAAGDPDLDARVSAALPGAAVLDAADTEGFSAAADAILDTDADAAFLLVCHDDVALSSNAVRQLVTESLRSNAGVAGPKLVEWDHPDRLQHVAYDVDRFAVAADVVEPAELDQEQYDSVADVFAVPSACVLIRTSLFRALGGFDAAMEHRGEDVDLCWRAQLLGARVMIVPDASVRHRGDLLGRTGIDDIRRSRARHQLRTVLVTGSRPGLAITLPLMALLTAAEAAIALVTGRIGQVRDVVGAWTWNLRRLGEIRERRRVLKERQRVPAREVAALQTRGSVRINAFVRGQIGRRTDDPQFREMMRTGTARIATVVAGLIALFVLFGSRTLVSDGVPALGGFAAFGDPGSMLGEWWSGWRHRGLGAPGTPPGSVAILGALSWLVGGSDGIVRLLWVLGPVVVGLWGAWRLTAVTGSRRAQIAALVAYTVVPLPWESLATADVGGLYAYAAAPWLLAALLHAQAISPFRTSVGPWRPLPLVGVGLGIGVGCAVLFAPAVWVVLVPMFAGLVVGALVTGRAGGVLRMSAALALALPVAAVVAAPQVFDQLAVGFSWAPYQAGNAPGPSTLRLAEIVGFAVASSPVAWATLVAVVPLAAPLLIGRSWRFSLAARGWFVALSGWGLAWAAARGALPFGTPDTAVLVAPAAAGVALVAAAAVTAFEHDLRRVGFGWRQALLPLSVVAAVVAAGPTLAMAGDGRWDMPRAGWDGVLPFADPAVDGSYRILWLGAPDDLPVDGRVVRDGLAWATTLDGLPRLADVSLPPDRGAAGLVADSLERALDGDTLRLGRTLGGLGVRYVVVTDRLAPAPFDESASPLPSGLTGTLDRQLDLRRRGGVNTAVRFYENTEWTSVRAAAGPGFDDGRLALVDLEEDPLRGTVGVFAGRGTDLRSVLPDGIEVFTAQTADTGWRLTVDGERAGRRRVLGYGTAFLPNAGGAGHLTYDGSLVRDMARILQIVALAASGMWLLRRRLGMATGSGR